MDFGDGVMTYGSPDRKIAITHDKQTGAGGRALGIVRFNNVFLLIFNYIQQITPFHRHCGGEAKVLYGYSSALRQTGLLW